MEMKFTVEQRQKISARQQQAASILQMGRMELDTFLSQAVLENPLLEYDETRKETYEEHDIKNRMAGGNGQAEHTVLQTGLCKPGGRYICLCRNGRKRGIGGVPYFSVLYISAG